MMPFHSFPLQITPSSGMTGEVIPYLLRTDWLITGILFLCLVLTSYAFSKGKTYLLQQLKSFFSTRERASLFDDVTATDIRYSFVLIVQTCVLLALYLYHYFTFASPQLFSTTSHLLILFLLFCAVIGYLTVKWILFYIVNQTFFSPTQNSLWMSAYWDVIIWTGFLFFPVIMLAVYFDMSAQNSLLLAAFVVLNMKILLFYRCFRNFFK